MTVPVGVKQVGCTVTEAVGGIAAGTVFTVKAAAGDTQPVVVFFTVTLYPPGMMLLKLVPVW